MKQISHELAKALMAEGFPVEVRYFADLPNKGRCPEPAATGKRATPISGDTFLRLTAKKAPAARAGSVAAVIRNQVRRAFDQSLTRKMARDDLVKKVCSFTPKQGEKKVRQTISKMLGKGFLVVAE